MNNAVTARYINSDTPRIDTAVIIVNWNGMRHLPECLSSLQRQIYHSFQLILVDNASQDDSVNFARRIFPGAKIIQFQQNTGFAYANNAAIKYALKNPDIQNLVLVNNDTRMEPDWLFRLVKSAEKHQEVASVSSLILNYYKPSRVDSAGHCLLRTGRVVNWGAGQSREKFQSPAYVFGPCAGGALYRRSFFERVGYFDERFFAYYEDVDINWRAVHTGLRCLFEPSAVLYHKVGGSSKGKRRFVTMSYRNRILVLVRNLPRTFIIRHFIPFVMNELWMLLVVLVSGHGNALRQAIADWPQYWDSRKNIQRGSCLKLDDLCSFIQPRPLS